MRRQLLLFVMPLALFASILGTASAGRVAAAHTKRQAEVNVLRAAPKTWTPRRLPGIINPRTHLLADNTEAICRGRGTRRAGGRYSRFVCVVRPSRHTPRQGLYVSYRALPRGLFRLRWLTFRRR
jgi:hypothetical protein